jgi:hypothetical protein
MAAKTSSRAEKRAAKKAVHTREAEKTIEKRKKAAKVTFLPFQEEPPRIYTVVFKRAMASRNL